MASKQDEPLPNQPQPPSVSGHGNFGPAGPQGLVAGIAQFLNVSSNADNAVAANLTPEHVGEMIRQNGRRADQSYNLKLWGLGFAAFVTLVVAGIIVFMTVSGETEFLGEIIFGIGGLIGGLFGGFSGGYIYANSRRR